MQLIIVAGHRTELLRYLDVPQGRGQDRFDQDAGTDAAEAEDEGWEVACRRRRPCDGCVGKASIHLRGAHDKHRQDARIALHRISDASHAQSLTQEYPYVEDSRAPCIL